MAKPTNTLPTAAELQAAQQVATDAKNKADAAEAKAVTAKNAADAAQTAAAGAPAAAASAATTAANTAAVAAQSVRVAADVAALKAAPRTPDTLVILMGKATSADGLGGTYYWDAASVEAEDLTYLNVVVATGVVTGRWKRIITKVTILPQGTLTVNAGVKTLYATATVVGSAGQATLNLTTNNLATGPAIFTEIWDNKSSVKPPSAAANVEDNINCDCQSEASDLKITTHVATRGSKTTLPAIATALLGLVITSQRYAPAGTVLRITVIGI